MATSVTFNGSTYSIPVVGERQWGTNVSNFLIAVAGNALSKAGGSFVLTTADVNFGTTYGLVTAYIKGAVGNISSTGIIRLANLDAISWRNAGNTADLALRVNASDRLQFGGVDIPTISSTDTLTNKTMSGASNTFTNLPVGVTGITAIANGGTAVSSLPTVQGASAFAAWDANQNLSANNLVNNYTTTATAAGTTTLTVSSKYNQFFTGSTTQTVTLPVASTLTIGHQFMVTNLSTGIVTVQSSGANSVIAMQPQERALITCILASGTSAASWSVDAELANSAATGALSLPSGTAAQRPTAVAGQVRLNTDSNSFEGYANGAWSSIGGGLNELPQKNYLKTWSDAVVSPGTLSTLALPTNNLVSLTAFYADSTSGASALSSSTSSTLRGTTNYLTATGTSDATGARFVQFPAFALEGTDLGKPVSVSFDVNNVTTDGNWDAVIVRYNSSGTHQSIISIAGNASSGTTPVSAKLPTGTTTFNGFFVPDSTTAGDLYALRLRSLANTVQIRVDTLFLGNQPARTGSMNTDWALYTPASTQGFGTVTSSEFWWKRTGDSIDISGRWTNGTVVASEARISLPNSYTIGTFTNTRVVGKMERNISTALAVKQMTVLAASGVSYLLFGLDDYTTAQAPLTAQNGDGISSNSNVMSFFATGIPVANFSSNVTMADRSVEEFGSTSGTWDLDSSTTVLGPQGTLMGGALTSSRAKTITWATTIQPTDKFVVELSEDRISWFDQDGFKNNAGTFLCYNLLSSLGSFATSSGAFIAKASAANQTQVTFCRYASLESDDSAVIDWSSSIYWRVRKVSGGAQVGYPISSANIVGRTDGNAPATGMVGQVVSFDTSSLTIQTTATVKNVATITNLPAGTWALFAGVELDPSTTLTVSNWEMSISGTSATTNSACAGTFANPSVSNYTAKGSVGPLIVNISAATTYYLTTVIRWTGSGGTWINARFQAIRIA
jgi:hypothetical protein